MLTDSGFLAASIKAKEEQLTVVDIVNPFIQTANEQLKECQRFQPSRLHPKCRTIMHNKRELSGGALCQNGLSIRLTKENY